MKPFSRDMQRIVVAVARAVLGPVEPEIESSRFLETFERMVGDLSPRDARAVRVLLRGLQVSPVLFACGRNLTAMPADAAERHLARLAASRIGPLRRGVAVVKTLVVYSWYGLSESWPAIGYGGPWLGRVEVERLPGPELERPA